MAAVDTELTGGRHRDRHGIAWPTWGLLPPQPSQKPGAARSLTCRARPRSCPRCRSPWRSATGSWRRASPPLPASSVSASPQRRAW